MAQRAQRFDDNMNNLYLAFVNQLILDDEIAYAMAVEQDERAYYEDYNISDRARWLMANKGMSLVDACEQVAIEEKKWAEETFDWLHDPKNFDSENYSDIYKDFYGVRPRW